MKTAICISGHFRTYLYLIHNFYSNVFCPFKKIGDVDIFIHTWDKLNAQKTAMSHLGNNNCYVEKDINEKEILGIYNPNKCVIGNYDKIKNKFLLSNFTNLECSNGLRSSEGVLYSTPMMYKMWACNELKKQYEIENNFKYDYVIRMRPDLVVRKEIDTNQLNLSKCNMWHINYLDKYFCDAVAIGSSEIIDIFCSTYANLKDIFSESSFDFMPERMFFRNVEKSGVEFHEIDNFFSLLGTDEKER